MTALVSKLQLYVQQVNSTLEDTSQQILAAMPRIMTDAQVTFNIIIHSISMTDIELKLGIFIDFTG